MAVKYRRARQTAWRTIAGETVLHDLEHKRMVGLNPAGARVWLALETALDPGELLYVTAGEGKSSFGEPDIAAFLDQLVILGLVEEHELAEAGTLSASAGGPAEGDPAEELEPPRVLWQEEVEQIAGTCAMFPSQNPLCDQAPFS